IVEEVVLDDLALVAQGDDELGEAVRRVSFHDVPEDRLAADLDHRFRFDRGRFGQPGAEAAGQDDDFHAALLTEYRVGGPARAKREAGREYLGRRWRGWQPVRDQALGSGLRIRSSSREEGGCGHAPILPRPGGGPEGVALESTYNSVKTCRPAAVSF